eukprot:sb/3472308/
MKRGRLVCGLGQGAWWARVQILKSKSTCVDSSKYRRSKCAEWRNSGFCTSGEYVKFMSDHCPATCRQCVSSGRQDNDRDDNNDGGTCADKRTECRGWKDSGYCTAQYSDFMKENCMKTCDHFGGGRTCDDSREHAANCPGFKQSGYCSSSSKYAAWMRENCGGTCGSC